MGNDEETQEPVAEPGLGEIAVPTLGARRDRDVESIADIGPALPARDSRRQTRDPGAADHLLPLRVPGQVYPLLLEHLASAG